MTNVTKIPVPEVMYDLDDNLLPISQFGNSTQPAELPEDNQGEKIFIFSFPRFATKNLQQTISDSLPRSQLKVQGLSHLGELFSVGFHTNRFYPADTSLLSLNHYTDDSKKGVFIEDRTSKTLWRVAYERSGNDGNIYLPKLSTHKQSATPLLRSFKPRDSFVVKVFPSLLNPVNLERIHKYISGLIGVVKAKPFVFLRDSLHDIAYSFLWMHASGVIPDSASTPMHVPGKLVYRPSDYDELVRWFTIFLEFCESTTYLKFRLSKLESLGEYLNIDLKSNAPRSTTTGKFSNEAEAEEACSRFNELFHTRYYFQLMETL